MWRDDQLMVKMDGNPRALCILRKIFEMEKNDRNQQLEFINASLFDIEILSTKGIHNLSNQ